MPKNVQLDTVDMNILSIITKDATVSYAEMGKKLYMSPATIHARVKKMQDSGIIKGQVVTLDYERLGYDICAFLGIYLEKSSMYHSVKAELLKIPEVIDAHYTTGVYSIFVKMVCKDTNHLREVLSVKIQGIKGIQRTETFISLEETINRSLSFD